METVESQLAVTKERVRLLEKWQDSCHWMEQSIHELMQWKKDQNGDIREIKEDLREMKTNMADLTISQGRRIHRINRRDRWLKWTLAGITIVSVTFSILVATHVL